MTRVDRQLVAVLDLAHDRGDVGEVEARMDALGIEVHRQGDDVDVAGALTVAEQGALDPVGAGHHRQFSGGHTGTTVIVGVDADDQVIAVLDVAAEPLDLVGVVVGGGALHRGRQVDDHLVVGTGPEGLAHGVDDLHRKVHLGGGEQLRRILEGPVGLGGRLHQVTDLGGGIDRNLDALGLVDIEHHTTEHRIGGVVDVNDGVLGALERFKGALDQVRAGLGQYLDGDVVRDLVFLDQAAHEVEVGLGGGGEAHLDLLEANLDQQIEETLLALLVHRIDQRLVTVAQIDAAPLGRGLDALAGPLPIRQVHGHEGAVLGRRVLEHHGVFSGIGCVERSVIGRPVGRPGQRLVGKSQVKTATPRSPEASGAS